MKHKILHKVNLLFLLSLGMSFSYAAPLGGAGTAPTARAQGAQAYQAVKATSADQANQSAPAAAAADQSAATGKGASSVYADQALPAGSEDPLERFNRVFFYFNDKLDAWILKPVATVYNKVMPKPLNTGINNVFNNIGTIPTIANDLLQLHIHQFANDCWRLGINTTIGIGGLFDVATRMHLQHYTNDFGLTLAYWGWDSSTYLVLPFFGPSTFRDTLGLPVDYFAFSIYPYIKPPSLRYQIYGLGVINRRAQLLQYQSVMEEAAIDKYVFIRNAYMQRRAYQINQTLSLGTEEVVQTASAQPVPVLSSETSMQ